MREELKPCPCCGTSVHVSDNDYIMCSGCGLMISKIDAPAGDFVTAWNTRAELAAIKSGQGEAAAHVSEESFSSDGTSDIITRNLPVGTALYTAPPASADAVSVPREFPAADDHEKAIGWEYSYEFISQVERLVASRTEFTTSMEAVQETLKAACELRALLAQSESKGVKL